MTVIRALLAAVLIPFATLPANAQPQYHIVSAFDVPFPQGQSPGRLTVTNDGRLFGITCGGGRYGGGTAFTVDANGALATVHDFVPAVDGGCPVDSLLQGADGNLYGVAHNGGPNGFGTLFRLESDGSITLLHAFSHTDGANPAARLMQAFDGYFYGTTQAGGAAGGGTVFQIDSDGEFVTIHDFSATTGPRAPAAPLVQGSDGALYGTTDSYGNVTYSGSVFRITTDGTLNVLHTFTSIARPGELLPHGSDFLGTTLRGGAYDAGTIFTIDSGGGFSIVHDFAWEEGAYPASGLLAPQNSPVGDIYGVASAGGPDGLGTIFRLATNGTVTSVQEFFYDGNNIASNGASPCAGLVQQPDGTIFGTTCGRDTPLEQAPGTVFRLPVAGAYTTLARFVRSATGSTPSAGVTVGSDGDLYGTTWTGGVGGYGTLFKVGVTNDPVTVHDFTATDGANAGALVLGADGLLYGTTEAGGDFGTALRVNVDGTITTLHNFQAGEGHNPFALAQAPDGSFYGATHYGGADDRGTLFRMSTVGNLEMLGMFGTPGGGSPNGSYPVGGLVVDSDGAAYGTTSVGGTNGLGTVFRIDSSHVLTTVHHFAPFDGGNPAGRLTLGADGNFYGTTSGSGPGGGGTVFRLTPGGALTLLHAFSYSDPANGVSPRSGVLIASDGALYGTTYAGGASDLGIVFRIDADGTFTVVHDFMGADGSRPVGELVEAGQSIYGTTSEGGPLNGGVAYRVALDGETAPPTETTLSVFPNPAFVGDTVTLQALVTTASGTPTGFVEFFDGATSLGTAPLIGGYAVQSVTFASGTHSLTANYLGGLFVPSTSSTVALSVSIPRATLTVAMTGAGTVNSSTDTGISCPTDCSEDYVRGTSVTLVASAAAGYLFTGWSGACTGVGSCSITMDADTNVAATFTPVYQLTVTVDGSGSGTVASSAGGISCPGTCNALLTSGDAVVLSAVPAIGSRFVGWSGNCSGTGSCALTMTSAKNVTATFARVYTLTVSAGAGGSITTSPAGISCPGTCSADFDSGTSVTVTPVPAAAYAFSAWSGACSGTSSCVVLMSASQSVTAAFTPVVPVPSFTAAPLVQNQATTFDPTGSTAPGAVLWEWDFDYQNATFTTDVSSTAPTLASYTFSTTGPHWVALRITTSAGSRAVRAQQLIVGAPPGAPTIDVRVPAQGGLYTVGQNVPVDYQCTDTGEVPSCAGSIPIGGSLDTASPGLKFLQVSSADSQGNATSVRTYYSVLSDAVVQPSVVLVTSSDGTVGVIDTRTNAIVRTIPVGAAPSGITTSPDGQFAYVTNRDSNSVTVIALATMSVAAAIPVGNGPINSSISPDGQRLYVVNGGDGSISVIDTAARAVVDTATIASPGGIRSLVVADGGATLMVLRTGGPLSIFDTSVGLTPVTDVSVGTAPQGLVVSSDGKRVLVPDSASDSVLVVDVVTRTVSGTLSVGASPNAVAFSPDGSLLYVSHAAGQVSVHDAQSGAQINSLQIAAAPPQVAAIAFAPRVYSASAVTQSVFVSDTGTGTLVGTIAVHGPGAIAVPPLVATLTVDAVDGYAGHTATARATLSTAAGPVALQRVVFSLFGTTIGVAQTNAYGIALLDVSLVNVAPGTYSGAIAARAESAGFVSPQVATATVTARSNNVPVALNGALAAVQDHVAHGVLGATDLDGDALTFSIVAAPSHGVITFLNPATGVFDYTPAQGYSGPDQFTFKASDGQADSNTATIGVTVAAGQHQLSVVISGGGTGTVSSSPAGITCPAACTAMFSHGTFVTLTATPDASSHFTGWSGSCSGTGGCTIDMSADRVAIAQFTPRTRDLTVTAASANATTVLPGGTVSVTDTIANIGDFSTVASTARFYLSADVLKDATDVLLSGTQSVPPLAAGATSTATTTVTIPASMQGGVFLLLVCADDTNLVAEGNETNNCLVGATIEVRRGDLIVSSISVVSSVFVSGMTDALIAPGLTMTASDTTTNQGTNSTNASTTRYYLSLDDRKSVDDVLLTGTHAVEILAAGQSSVYSAVKVTVPANMPLGTYRFLACADDLNKNIESNEFNNCSAAAINVIVALPDLHQISVSSTSSALPGGSLTITDTVVNEGGFPITSTTTTRYYLSPDGTKSASAVLLTGSRSVPYLSMGQSSTGSKAVTVPSGTALGLYYLLACADDTQHQRELSETNNCASTTAAAVVVGRPDLTVDAVTEPPVQTALGLTFPMTDTTANDGQLSSSTTSTRYYLSKDRVKDAGDTLMAGTHSVPILAPGIVSTTTTTVTVPATLSLPGGLAYYYVLACSDDTQKVAENDETNNCLASTGLVAIKAPDLLMSSATMGVDVTQVVAGGSFYVSDVTANYGTYASPASATGYWLAYYDDLNQLHTVPLSGSRSIPTLSPGQTSGGPLLKVTVPLGTPARGYYLRVCADSKSKVAELNESNNCALAVAPSYFAFIVVN